MADVKVESPSYAKLAHLAGTMSPTEPNYRNVMRDKAAAFQKEVRAPKLSARKDAKAQARGVWLARQSPEVQKAFAEKGHA